MLNVLLVLALFLVVVLLIRWRARIDLAGIRAAAEADADYRTIVLALAQFHSNSQESPATEDVNASKPLIVFDALREKQERREAVWSAYIETLDFDREQVTDDDSLP